MRRWWIAAVVLLLIIQSQLAHLAAQSDVLQNYRSDDLGLALQYPSGWKLQENLATQTITTASESDLNAVQQGKQPDGLIFSVSITSFRQLNAETPDDFAAILKQVTATPDAKPSAIRIGGADGVFVDTQDPNQQVATRTVLLSIGRRRVAVIRGITTITGWFTDNGEQTFNDLTSRLTFFPPPNRPDLDSVGRVLWQLPADQFPNLAGLALSSDASTLYITDLNQGIWKVSTNGVSGSTFKPDGIGQFSSIGVRGDGIQIVADPGTHTIWMIPPGSDQNPPTATRFAGGKVGTQAGQFGDQSPRIFTFGIQSLVYALDENNGDTRVQVFDRGGGFMGSWDLSKMIATPLDTPSISSDDANFIYITAKNKPAVTKLNVAGALIKDGIGQDVLTGTEPLALALDRFDNIYVATSDQGILKLNQSGKLLGVIGEAYDESAPPKPGQLARPIAMAIEPENGLMYVLDGGRYPQVVAFALNGNAAVNVSAGTKSAGQMLYGEVTNGQIDNSTFIYAYTFEGKAGDIVTMTMRADKDSKLDSYLELISPSGTKLAANDDAKTSDLGPLDAQIRNYRLPVTGTYTINAMRFGGETTNTGGAYILSLDRVGGTQGS